MSVPEVRESTHVGRVSRRTILGDSIGSVTNGVFGSVPSLMLLIFLTDTLGVPAALAGLAVFIPKVFDVFWNPLVGGWSDHTVTRWGPRRPWLFLGAVTLPPLFVVTFAVPGFSSGYGHALAAAWVCVFFLLAGAAYGVFQVPYTVLPSELTDEPAERSRILMYRVIVLAVGILVGGGLAPAIVDGVGHDRAGYLTMAAVVAAVLAIAMLICTRLVPTRERAHDADPHLGKSVTAALRVATARPPYWAIYTAYLAQSLAIAVALAAIPYFTKYVMGDESYTSVLFVAFVGTSIVVVPIWRRFEHRWGKINCLMTGSWIFAGSSLLVGLSGGGVVLAVVGFFGCGIGYASQQLFAYSLLGDVLANDDDTSGRRTSGLLAGLWTASETGMFALGPAAVGGLLAVFGFVSSEADQIVTQPGSALLGISLAMGVLPGIMVAISVTRLRRFARLTPAPS
jgi:GPH family glycoside/pentoside/hexuronide:cation symporter